MRVSAVGFLNSAPLVWGLMAGRAPAGWEVSFDLPSRCAARLKSREADLGLVPSAVFLREPDLFLAAPLGVVAPREAASVLLLRGGPLEGLRKVTLDPASRTSQALLCHLLKKRLSHEPVYVEAELPATLGEAEGALVIGDPALRLPAGLSELPADDLAALWREETGLPFVFAVWAGRREVCTRETARVLLRSLEEGIASLNEIVTQGARRLGLAEARIRRYLTENLAFRLGPEERASLRRFAEEVLGCPQAAERIGEDLGTR